MGDYEGNNIMSHLVRDMDHKELMNLLEPKDDINANRESDLRYFQKRRDDLIAELTKVNKQIDLLSEAVLIYKLTQHRSREAKNA